MRPGRAGHDARLSYVRIAPSRREQRGGATPGAEARERMERVESSARTALLPHEQVRAWSAGQTTPPQHILADELRAADDAAFWP